MRKYLIIAAAVLAVFTGCREKKDKTSLLPNVSGKAGEIVIQIDRENWEGAIGSAFREILAEDCPYLAQREPLFNLINVPPASFGSMFRMHRNIIILRIDPQGASEGIKYEKNVWARPQSVAQVNAFSAESALALIRENGALLAEYFEQAERDRIIVNSIRYEEGSLRPYVEKLTGGVLHFPSGYKLKKTTEDFLWITDEKQYTTQTVLIYRYPALGDARDFSVGNIISHRNSVMERNVPGPSDGSYMTTSMYVEPSVASLRYHNRDFMQTRGFWEVHGDYMGGPFVSHSFYSQDGKDIIVLEAFVYAPRYDKRQYLRQVESILYSFEWKKDEI